MTKRTMCSIRFARLSQQCRTLSRIRLASLVYHDRFCSLTFLNCHPPNEPHDIQAARVTEAIARPTMNFISSLFWIVKILVMIVADRPDSWTNDVIEKFYWTSRNDYGNIQWEFFVIGKRVTWNVGKILCSSRDSTRSTINEESFGDIFIRENSTITRRHERMNRDNGLAVLLEDDAMMWFSRMLSESNYQYDGLWIGGHRKDSKSNWTWIGDEDKEERPIKSSSILSNYPTWYKIDDYHENSRNCLIFDRNGHNLPLLVPTDCELKKPFVCSRVVTKKIPETIVEGLSVVVDGYRYTLFSVNEGEKVDTEGTSAVRRLNGGGVKWIDARLECRKRGLYLGMVMSNEAAIKIASVMLKNRPSMESVWLGGWSTDGTNWTWSTTGLILSSTQSSTSKYPPWLNGHPIASSRIDENYQKHGRCLILDRHLCPDHMNPVFLDLDCEKKRPFVCQDDIPDRRTATVNDGAPANRIISIGNRILEFSADRMTWTEGQAYCANNNGRIASILDSKTLSTVLDRMTELYLHHVWVGGRTVKTSDGWRWFDETGKAVTRKGIGIRVSWCLGDDEATMPKADPDNCLNLDREGYGLPLFYGLPCNFTKQHVLCNLDNASRSLSPSVRNEEKNVSSKLEKAEDAKLSLSGRKLFDERSFAIDRKSDNENNEKSATIANGNEHDLSNNDIVNSTSTRLESAKNESRDVTNEFRLLKGEINGVNGTNASGKKKRTKVARKLADLDEETKELLVASGYNISDSDLILGLELEVVDLAENSTINKIDEKPTTHDKYKKYK